MGWWYVFGSASMTLLMIQVAHRHRAWHSCMYPRPIRAYDSLLYLNYEHPAGWFLRALHYYAGFRHGRHGPGPSDPGLPSWGLQVPA